MKKLIDFFLHRTFLVNLISGFVILAGGVIYTSLHKDMTPPFDRPVISVQGQLEGASPVQVERYVVRPIEDIIKNETGLEEVNTNVESGSFDIRMVFKSSHDDLQTSLDNVKTAVQGIQSSLPDKLENLNIRLRTKNRGWMGSFALTGDLVKAPNIRQIANQFQDKITDISGIVLMRSEFDQRQLIVHLDAQALSRASIRSSDIISKIRSLLTPKAAGSFEVDAKKISLEILDPSFSLKTLGETPIKSPQAGAPILLKDLAQIAWKDDSSERLRNLNGKRFISFYAFKDLQTDIIDLSHKIKDAVQDFNKTLPEGSQVLITGLGSDYVAHQIDVLTTNALIGLTLVILILGFFLGIRAALLTAFSLPLAYAFAGIILAIAGISLNLVTLVAMIIILGILVDDAIIVTEQYVQNREAGMDTSEAASTAAVQLLPPVTATIATTAIAFLPILAIDGYLKELFTALPIVIVSTLAASWFESFFILPNHLKDFLKKPKSKASYGTRTIIKLRSFYQLTLEFVLKLRYVILVALLCVAGITIYMSSQKIKTRFHLRFGDESIRIVAVLNDTKSIANSQEQLKPIEDYLLSLKKSEPAIEEIFTSIGNVWVDRSRQKHPRYATFDVDIDGSSSDSIKNKARIQKIIAKFIKPLSKTDTFERLSVGSSMQGSEEELKDIVSISFKGKGTEDFFTLKDFVETAASGLPHFTGLSYNENTLQRSWVFNPDLAKLNSYGVDSASLGQQLSLYTESVPVGYTYFEDEQIRIFASMGDLSNSPEFTQLSDIKILSDQNILVPITYLGSWKDTQNFGSIERENGKRIIRFDLKFNTLTTDAQKFKTSADTQLLDTLSKQFPNYKISSDFGDEELEKNRSWMIKAVSLCIVGVLFVLALQLGSILQPLIVASVIPFGAFGALWALYLHGMDLNLMGMIGLLGVAGVAVNDSIILVDQCNLLRDENGRLSKKQLIAGASSRLRAITLTTITTLGGLFPMAYGLGGDSGFTRPIAFTMAWGLLASTLLTLIFIPVLLDILEDIKNYFARILNRSNKKA